MPLDRELGPLLRSIPGKVSLLTCQDVPEYHQMRNLANNLLSLLAISLRRTTFRFSCASIITILVARFCICPFVPIRPTEIQFLAATSHPRADPCHRLLQQ